MLHSLKFPSGRRRARPTARTQRPMRDRARRAVVAQVLLKGPPDCGARCDHALDAEQRGTLDG